MFRTIENIFIDPVGNNSASFGQFIGKPAPIIAWNNPPDIVYGTPLSNTQLDATASVPGTFVYTPAAGTVLGVGTQTLTAFFTPTDNIDYTTTSANVSINVKNPGNSGMTFTNSGNNNVYIINPSTSTLETEFWPSSVVPTITWNTLKTNPMSQTLDLLRQ